MCNLLLFFQIALSFWASPTWAAVYLSDAEVTVPGIERMNSSFLIGTGLQHHEVRPTCDSRLSRSRSENLSLALQITRAANREFRRRGWPEAFLEGRIDLVEKYLDRSYYVGVSQRGRGFEVSMQGTLAVTWAEGDASNLYSSLLPEEETLGIRLPRFVDSNGKWIVFEFRTLSMLRPTNVKVFPFILMQTSQPLFEKLKQYPELIGKPIINTYTDLQELYTAKNLSLVNEVTPADKPIRAYNLDWWAMSETPLQLEEYIYGMRMPREDRHRSEDDRYSWIPTHPTFFGFNQAMKTPLPGAPEARSAPHTHIAFDENGQVASTILAEDTLFASGIWGAKGAHVVQFFGSVAIISSTARDYRDPRTGRLILKGSSLSFSGDKIVGVNGQTWP